MLSISSPWKLAFNTFSTLTSFTHPIRQFNKPSQSINGVHDLELQTSKPRHLQIMPFGIGDNDSVGNIYVYGWLPLSSNGKKIWVPYLISNFQFKLPSVSPGVLLNDPILADSAKAADEITISNPKAASGTVSQQVILCNGANASVIVPSQSPYVLQFFGVANPPALTEVNALFRFIEN